MQPIATLAPAAPPVGVQLRRWRERRRLSQLALALESDISTRHLSFVETGRAQPSREMVLRLAERLAVPLRERNALLLAAGYAPVYPQRPLDDSALAPARAAVDLVLAGHEPYPAIAVDRHWTLVSANAAAQRLLAGLAAELLQPPVNVLRLSLHPRGLAPRIANLAQWRAHLLTRLRQQIEIGGDPQLEALLAELKALDHATPNQEPQASNLIVVPLTLATPSGLLNLISTTTIFGTPIDVTLAELAIESFFPADAATSEILRRLAAGAPDAPAAV